jgi:hypothetical protein
VPNSFRPVPGFRGTPFQGFNQRPTCGIIRQSIF